MLENVDLTLKMESKQSYKETLKQTQIELLQLQRELFERKMGCIIVMEGWDAAGKGGAIKRLTRGLDPRGYQVHPIAAPTTLEKNEHYLMRFWRKIPAYGSVAIFDRSWYGRVLVERVEELTDSENWKRAYQEINQMEEMLTNDRYIIIKLWYHISKEEQLRRFKEREGDPLKQWKLTDEDWRNRSKWMQYEEAVEDMIAKTSTTRSEWNIIPAESKHYARVTTNQIIINTIRAKLS
ncbi:polyphosphate kinase 2 family protein [Pontibacillus litoralis]|uniref:UDP-galactose-lipid carrier transferase n=1 Tax=Pontibacillus litoralis JSM 072002 TaxID=1385512 RepID=A0A0A5G8U3_9BACI|nr:UDP-galactose-lipid carrier transferase [Pontibacillus litoralis]KGX87510.1 UDP-galactose-lipid carrier transferase [Pontibacillus litoralis JSM 072002]